MTASAGGVADRKQAPMVMRILSALLLLATGLIHLVLVVFVHVGGVLGVLFVLNGIAGVVLAVGVLALRGRLRTAAIVLGLLFLIASLAALLLALTVGLFGITETWGFTLVPETVVVEAIGIVVLAVTAVMARRGAVASPATGEPRPGS